MKIGNINVYGGTVNIANNIEKIQGVDWGITKEELDKLTHILSVHNDEYIRFVRESFKKEELDKLSITQKNKFVEFLKKWGLDFSVDLTVVGIVELLKAAFVPS